MTKFNDTALTSEHIELGLSLLDKHNNFDVDWLRSHAAIAINILNQVSGYASEDPCISIDDINESLFNGKYRNIVVTSLKYLRQAGLVSLENLIDMSDYDCSNRILMCGSGYVRTELGEELINEILEEK